MPLGRANKVARAIWKGNIVLSKHEVPIKVYSGVEARDIHFRLLHAKDKAPVEQRIVRKDTGREVPKEARRKAFPISRNEAVILQPEDLEGLEPPPSRDISLCRFVPRSALSDQWYDRPYYLGPDEDDESYFALAEAIERQQRVGIAQWVMRKSRYVGALDVVNGYLMMVTLRRADQIMSFAGIEPPKSALPNEGELKLAEQLMTTITGDFEPELWENEYRKRVMALIEAKARGDRIAPFRRKPKAAPASLADSLKASLTAARERKVA